MKKFFCIAFLCLAHTGFAQSPFTFSFADERLADQSFSTIDLIDFDRDGDLDVFLSGNEGLAVAAQPSARLFEFDSRSVVIITDTISYPFIDFQEMTVPITGRWFSDSEWVDANGDGFLDLFLMGSDSPSAPYAGGLEYHENVAGQSLTPRAIPSITLLSGAIDSGDMDNDGDIDVVLIGTNGGVPTTVVLEQDDVGFQQVASAFEGYAHGDIELIDIDKDEDLDVVICGVDAQGQFVTAIYRNSGFGVFDTPALELPGYAFADLEFGDYDNDADVDILVTGGQLAPEVFGGVAVIYENIGTTFVNAGLSFTGAVAGAATWIDLNNDGVLDVVIAGGTDADAGSQIHRVYLGTADSDYIHATNLPATFPTHSAVGDYEGDYDIDLVVGGLDATFNNNTYLYENQQRVPNDPPSAPTSLSASVSGGSVNLAWGASEDENTAAQSLTYELRVGSAPGNSDVVSTVARPDGYRALAQNGNVGLNTSWFLTELPNGTYYWSVQAVDNGRAGSAFSNEASFEVTESNAVKTGTDPELASNEIIGIPYPNPFTSALTIPFDKPATGSVEIQIFNVVGMRVGRIDVSAEAVGRGARVWKGLDDAGAALPSGLYFIVASTDEQRVARKVTLVK